MITLTSICSCDFRDEYVIDGSKKLYSIGSNVESFLTLRGYNDYSIKAPSDLARNLNGDELFVFNRKEHKGLIITCDGDIFEWKLPGRHVLTWLNHENKVVAWKKDRVVHYSTPPYDKKQLMSSVKNANGGYFVMSIPHWRLAIFSLESQDSPLAITQLRGTGVLRIFSKGNKVYLFDYITKDGPLIGYVFLKQGSQLLKIEEIEIHRPYPSPAPFYVEDLSPWSDDILLVDVHDFPSISKWYIFNLTTRKMRKLGNRDGYGFFLSCDMLKSREGM